MALTALVLGAALIVAGVAFFSVPVALIVAGLLIAAPAALYIDW